MSRGSYKQWKGRSHQTLTRSPRATIRHERKQLKAKIKTKEDRVKGRRKEGKEGREGEGSTAPIERPHRPMRVVAPFERR